MQSAQPKPLALTASDIAPAWVHDVRNIILRDNHTIRAGKQWPTIEVLNADAGRWQPLNLPAASLTCVFASHGDRDVILKWLTGEVALPPLAHD
jgi:hypothetical protein